jgi:hypothetical protein
MRRVFGINPWIYWRNCNKRPQSIDSFIWDVILRVWKSNEMTTKEFITYTQLTDTMAARVFATMSWNKMLEVRSDFCRALDAYSKKHKGTLGGIDQVQLDAIGAIARFDRLLRTYYYNNNKTHPRFYGMDISKAKGIILKDFHDLTKRKY